jgi:hypothetical protein
MKFKFYNDIFCRGMPEILSNRREYRKCPRPIQDQYTTKIGQLDGNPRTLFFTRIFKLIFNGAKLQSTYEDSGDSKERYGDSGVRRSARCTIGGALFLLFGAALLKVAFELTDAPKNPTWLLVGAWGIGAVASFMIYQGTILVLTGNWRISAMRQRSAPGGQTSCGSCAIIPGNCAVAFCVSNASTPSAKPNAIDVA